MSRMNDVTDDWSPADEPDNGLGVFAVVLVGFILTAVFAWLIGA